MPAAPLPKRTGVLVVRVWLEDELPDALRARITSTVDLTRREVAVSMASTPEAIQDAVRAWLDAFASADSAARPGSRAPGDGPVTTE
jgi:hypothetical protein